METAGAPLVERRKKKGLVVLSSLFLSVRLPSYKQYNAITLDGISTIIRSKLLLFSLCSVSPFQTAWIRDEFAKNLDAQKSMMNNFAAWDSPGAFEWAELQDYVAVYGMHLLLGFLLIAVTVFRREMSCNRVFHEEEEEKSVLSSPEQSYMSDAMEEEAEGLLESAGNFCSCQPIVHLASVWMDSIPDKDDEEPAMRLLHHNVTPTDLLDRVGNFYSGEPIVHYAAHFLQEKSVPHVCVGEQYDPFTNVLPPDVHVHITSFLHPRDILALSGVSRAYRAVVDESNTSKAIWRTLFERDYAWVLSRWAPGKEAMRRSCRSLRIDKDFYFRFGETYLDYVLAANNVKSRCLVGLHCHVYDITTFLDTHPGSPDTLIVHSGKISTRFFEDMGHSLVARRLARSMCVVVDMSQLSSDGWGLRPTESTVLEKEGMANVPPVYRNAGENLLLGRRQRRRGGTLKRIRASIDSELAAVERKLDRHFAGNHDVIGTVNPFYDPVRQQWCYWYTNVDLVPVFGPA